MWSAISQGGLTSCLGNRGLISKHSLDGVPPFFRTLSQRQSRMEYIRSVTSRGKPRAYAMIVVCRSSIYLCERDSEWSFERGVALVPGEVLAARHSLEWHKKRRAVVSSPLILKCHQTDVTSVLESPIEQYDIEGTREWEAIGWNRGTGRSV